MRLPPRIVVVLVPWLISGCSLFAVRGDSGARDGRQCSAPSVSPVIDGWLEAPDGAPDVTAAVRPPCDPSRPSSGFTGPCFIGRSSSEHRAGGAQIAVDLLQAAAATYGRLKVSACREARGKLAIPLAELAAAPRLDPARRR